MIIRSQDKKSITKDLNLQILKNDFINDFEISNRFGIELGVYSTEEKAIKVLDMIQNAYTQFGTLKMDWVVFTEYLIFQSVSKCHKIMRCRT